MKTVLLHFLLFITITLSLLTGCEKNDEKNDINLPVSGQLIGYSDCKNEKSFQMTSDTLSCVKYSFDAVTNILSLTHINTAFNCCPENLYCEIIPKNDTIIIQELENSPQCHCNCLYDLDIEIQNIKTQKYQLKFIEPYADEHQEISFELDLTTTTEGSYCITRKNYPWGMQKLKNYLIKINDKK